MLCPVGHTAPPRWAIDDFSWVYGWHGGAVFDRQNGVLRPLCVLETQLGHLSTEWTWAGMRMGLSY